VLYFQLTSAASLPVPSTYGLMLEILSWLFWIYVASNCVAGVIFYFWRRFPPAIFQWLVFTLGILDGLFIAGLVFITDGYESMAYWMFPGLIVLNAISIPLATPQIVLNLLFSAFYISAGILNAEVPLPELVTPPAKVIFRQAAGTRPRPAHNSDLPFSTDTDETGIKPDLPRLFVLWLLAACCYGVQVLRERQRRAAEEAAEFAARESQLHAAGRLAAEFAHQIKNPLAIINNTAFSLQHSLRAGKTGTVEQIEIIQEEVARADRVITRIMGYAQLSEGRVEKLDVIEAFDRAIEQVFPQAMPTGIKIRREFVRYCQPLLMQRGHLSEILVNLLQNAREALGEKGNVLVTVDCHHEHSVDISVRDDGPGIPPDKIERVFEAYYTTKERGTGLGLAIVKHNVELYGGSVRVESELGKGAKFIVKFPAKAVMKLSLK
jgi:signal transduction histidine kinase